MHASGMSHADEWLADTDGTWCDDSDPYTQIYTTVI